jgi:membrane protease YdiL (CAAX protease family)
LCMPQLVVIASKSIVHVPVVTKAENAKTTQTDDSHPLTRILADSRDPGVILLCLVSAVIIAPISEELVFRLVLQGWLESLERRIRRKMPLLRRMVGGVIPVVLVAALFAAMHIRTPSARMELSEVVFLLSVFSAAGVLTIVVLACWLRFVAGATLADFGIVPDKLRDDVLLGLLAFLAFTPPIYAVMIAFKVFVPAISVPDPIPIFLLGAAFGGLYYRTHRIVPSMVMHAAFNAIGVLAAIAMTR